LKNNVILIRYTDDELVRLTQIPEGDWIDLRAAENVEMRAGEEHNISLGVAMRLPDGYEAIVAQRSSTDRNFGIEMRNKIGIIDNSYCGNNDIWQFPARALRNTVIHKNDRICQFRIQKKQPTAVFLEVDCLPDEDRGGLGSTGRN